MDSYKNIEILRNSLMSDIKPIFNKFSKKINDKIKENLVQYNKNFKNSKCFDNFLNHLIILANTVNKIKTHRDLSKEIGYSKFLQNYNEDLLLLNQDYLDNLENELIKLHDNFEKIKVDLYYWEFLHLSAHCCFDHVFKGVFYHNLNIDYLNYEELNYMTEYIVDRIYHHSCLNFKDYIVYFEHTDSFIQNLNFIINKAHEFQNNCSLAEESEQVNVLICKLEISEIKESYENLLNYFKPAQNYVQELLSLSHKPNLEKSKVFDINSFEKIQKNFKKNVLEALEKTLLNFN